MAEERQVWIVGDIEAGARAGDQRYHTGHCYVLDQIGNRDRTQKVPLTSLPDSFEPCQICAPGTRRSPAGAARPPTRVNERPTGVRPGHEVEIEDLETGDVRTIRISEPGQPAVDGDISPGSPLGSALLGHERNAVVEFVPPRGRVRTLRVLRFG